MLGTSSEWHSGSQLVAEWTNKNRINIGKPDNAKVRLTSTILLSFGLTVKQ